MKSQAAVKPVFTGVSAANIRYLRGQIQPLVDKALQRSGTDKYQNAGLILDDCEKNLRQCWIYFDTCVIATIITHIATFPTGYKRIEVDAIGGSRMDEWLAESVYEISDYARSQGCREIYSGGRKGWIKALKRVGINLQVTNEYIGEL